MSHSIPTRTALPLMRSAAIVALMSAPLVALPLAAHADSTTPFRMAQATAVPAAANPTEEKTETVEQRITNLHAALKITPEQESQWNKVAQAMRDNAANMEKLVVEKRRTGPQNMTAIDDLETYQKFAQAHVDGLKNLTSAFKSLYSTMDDGQKKNADDVFANFGRTPQHG
jgi:protein CpxP